ncbi:hypothetical protein LWC08_03060 [Desulfobaculum bizertense]|uniref:hypothetical protein n=1 Tax=Desulfobaculum bizertense TaxID=376490 RepID=UPI001F323971|nr:hypothetical protein [Desulfobaculum bizertense]UIJ38563.1 hypothetical protein LWC08_03060 [Desulfobaculum bizertense]
MEQVPLLSLGELEKRVLHLMELMAIHPDAVPATTQILHVAGIGVQQAVLRAKEAHESPARTLRRLNREYAGRQIHAAK